MKYDTPELLTVGAVENTVLETTVGTIWDNGTDMGSSTKINSLLDID